MTDTSGTTAPPSVAEPHTDDDFDDEAAGSTQNDGDTDSSNSSEDDGPLGEAGQRALTRMKNERAQARRELTQARSRIAELERAGQTESERAIAEAEARGRTSALEEVNTRLARAAFDTRAARRNPDLTEEDLDETLAFVDMKKFLDDQGEINTTALQSAVERLIPAKAPTGPADQDGGPRRTARVDDMNSIIRNQARGNRVSG